MYPPKDKARTIDAVVREEWGRILASLVAHLGDFQLAEDCLQDAVVKAMDRWARDGMPASPAAWLITVARRGAIDRLRRDAVFRGKADELAYLQGLEAEEDDMGAVPDQRLEMMFTCCHPAIGQKAQVALTLRTLGGLSTEEIAAGFLDKPTAMAQRLVRAKAKIRDAGIPYKVPEDDALAERLGSVCQVIYLIFNEGYAARSGVAVTRGDLAAGAIRLGRILYRLMPEPEVGGLLALMLLHDARRFARVDAMGAMVALEHQNRARWDQAQIAEGDQLLRGALARGQVGAYQLQAAISAVHAHAQDWESTDWAEISALYAVLYKIEPSAVVRINQAVAVSYAGDTTAGLAMLEAAGEGGALESYQPYYAARGDLLARAGDIVEARGSFDRAIKLSENETQKAFLERKRARLN